MVKTKRNSLFFVLILLSTAFFLSSINLAFPTAKADTQINIYAGEKSSSVYGFGNSASNINSPGPTITLITGQTVTITLHNSGTMPHNFAIVDAKSSTANVLWGAQIQSNSNPVNPGNTGSVTFTVGSVGNYYYICQVDGHVALGMWGHLAVVNSAPTATPTATVPEFPLLTILPIFLIAMLTVALMIRKNKK